MNTQEAFMIIERLAALVATPGINATTAKLANEQIQIVMNSVIKVAITKLSATSVGLLV